MIIETKTETGTADILLGEYIETVEYVATVETDIQVGAGGGRYVTDTRVTFDEGTLDGVDCLDAEVESKLYSEVAG